MKIVLKILFIVQIIFLSACSNKSDTSEKPWMGYAFSKKDNRAEFFSHHMTARKLALKI